LPSILLAQVLPVKVLPTNAITGSFAFKYSGFGILSSPFGG